MPGTPRLTMIANFAITYRCNSRCSTCGIWKMEDRGRDELSVDEIRGFFEGEADFFSGVRTIQLTGGEPYLRGDIAGIAEAIWEGIPRAFIWVATNGLLPEGIHAHTQEMLEKKGGGGVGVTVSIDGVDRVHDDQRGVEGAYSRACETLRKLAKLRERHPTLRLSVGMTITPNNQHQIVEALTTAEHYDADFTVRPVNVSEAYYRNSKLPGEWRFDELASGLEAVARHTIRRRGPIKAAPVTSYLNRIPNYIAAGSRGFSCSASTSSLFIDPTGEVYPCLFVGDSLGNIKRDSMRDVWSSPRCVEARRRIAEGRCPGCLVECEAMRDIRRDKKGLIAAALRGIRLSLSS